jgi:hypothetical protein
MTDGEFEAMARAMPQATWADHFGQGAYKVAGKKIFACPSSTRAGKAILKLTPEQQEMLCAAEPAIFIAPDDHWGRQGWTQFVVAAADEATARSALWTAWRNVAPMTLRKLHP